MVAACSGRLAVIGSSANNTGVSYDRSRVGIRPLALQLHNRLSRRQREGPDWVWPNADTDARAKETSVAPSLGSIATPSGILISGSASGGRSLDAGDTARKT